MWFGQFAEEVGPENVRLIMHTDPKDPHGQDIHALLKDHNFADGRIVFLAKKFHLRSYLRCTIYLIAQLISQMQRALVWQL